MELTPRQSEIKDRLDKDMSAIEIADELQISRNAVYQQIQALRKKGELPSGYTPSGRAPRESGRVLSSDQNGHTLSARLIDALTDTSDELRRMADKLDTYLG